MQIIIQKGCGLMTVQQQVCARIINMSDEGAAFIEQVINNGVSQHLCWYACFWQ